MRKITQEQQFNSQHLDTKYKNIWDRGIHLFSVNDHNRDFCYSFFYLDLLFIQVIYNKLTGEIIAIKSFTDKAKLMFFLKEDFS